MALKNGSAFLLRALLVAMPGLAVQRTGAQVVNEDDLRKIVLQGNEMPLVSLECLPDGHTVWAMGATGDRILVLDTAGWAVVRTIPLSGFGRGAEMTASADGRYMLLKAVPPNSDPNRPGETHLAVLDAATGSVVLDVPAARDGCLVPGSDAVAMLKDETVTVQPFRGNPRSFKVPGAAYAIAVDPEAMFIAAAVYPDAGSLGRVPAIRNDRKAVKAALKYRQMVVVHALGDGTRTNAVPEVYDLVQHMHFTDHGRLLVYSVPDTRAGMTAGGHVEQVDLATWEPLRARFMTWTARPPLAVAPDGATLALSSVQGRNKRKLTLYDLATGDTRVMIDLEQKHRYDKLEGERHDARLGYAWLADGRLLVAQGPSIGCYRR